MEHKYTRQTGLKNHLPITEGLDHTPELHLLLDVLLHLRAARSDRHSHRPRPLTD